MSDPTQKAVKGLETHHNQPITEGAVARLRKNDTAAAVPAQKRLMLRLDQREALALEHLGGKSALKALLAPQGRCVACRAAPSVEGTPADAYCSACATGLGNHSKP